MNLRVFPPWRLGRLLGYAMAAALLIAPVAFAQFQTGNIYGTVTDNQGATLPGVTVTLSGGGRAQTFVTDSDGQFRFLSLAPGQYSVKADLAGFGSVARSDVMVNIGANSTVNMRLQPAVEQTITVTAETPLLDVRKIATGGTVARVELDEIPSARDPWVVMQKIPGVLVDRINVGGSESGQQSNYVAKGADSSQATWNYDGVNITDMAATGASPTYYDFDAFEEMQVTTGGSDPRLHTAGVNLNMVTKRGTNELRGSGRYFMTDNEWQADPVVPTEAQLYLRQVNEINHIEDFGLELGGPIIRDRLWLWGAYGEQNIENLAAAGLPELYHDDTFLTNYNLKANAQILDNNSAVLFLFEGSKEKFGRNVSPTRPPETAWNQGNLGGGPFNDGSWFVKFEDTHIFSPNFFLTGLLSDVDMGFFLTPVGGRSAEAWLELDPGTSWHRSFVHYESVRPMEAYRLDGSTFFDTGAANHELKFGFGYRDTPTQSLTAWPGSGNWGSIYDAATNFGMAYLTRPGAASYGSDYTDLYVGDTILWGNLTLQGGLRFDLQHGSNLAGSVPANPLVPDLLPSVTFTGDTEELEWDTISPRIGLTYSMGSTKRTLLRAAYNQYADQLGAAAGYVLGHPFYSNQAVYYYWEDRNGDRTIQRPEILFGDGLQGFYGLDPDDPGRPLSTTRIDYDMDVPRTDEIILGIEHELMPEFTVALNYTMREKDDLAARLWEKTRGAGDFYTAADYVPGAVATGTTPDGTPYSVQTYKLKPGVGPPTFGVVTNRPGYSREFNGIDLALTKRLSSRWMLRGGISWSDNTQNVDNLYAPDGDPTPRLAGYGCTNCDGEIVVEGSGTGSGSKGGIYLHSNWGYNITGLVQLPWDINLSAAINGREGYPIPFYHRVNNGDGRGNQFVLVDGVEPARHEDIHIVDLRLAKDIKLFRDLGVTLSIDGFNVTDERTILQREHRLYTSVTRKNPTANRIREMVSPQVFRVGAKITF